MNLFMLDDDPIRCARYHCDEHVARSMMEYTQMLTTAHMQSSGECPIKYNGKPAFIMEETFLHPCSRWARTNLANYLWLLDVANELLYQYKSRFRHDTAWRSPIDQLHTPPRQLLKFQQRTPVPLILPVEFHRTDVVQAYREYYVARKGKLGKWSPPASAPPWWEAMKRDRVEAGGSLI